MDKIKTVGFMNRSNILPIADDPYEGGSYPAVRRYISMEPRIVAPKKHVNRTKAMHIDNVVVRASPMSWLVVYGVLCLVASICLSLAYLGTSL